jgi:hypothetical protein
MGPDGFLVPQISIDNGPCHFTIDLIRVIARWGFFRLKGGGR